MQKVDAQIRKIVALPENIVPFLVPGRLIKISIMQTNSTEQDWGWGILVNFTKQRINPKNIQCVGAKNKELEEIIDFNESHYLLDVYLYVKDKLTNENLCQPGSKSLKDGRLGIVPVILHPSTLNLKNNSNFK